MVMFETIKTLIDFGKTLLGLQADLEKTDLEKRTRIADYLDKNANCLHDIVVSFRNDELPHEACGALSGYMRSLMSAIGGVVNPEDLEHYSSLLTQANLTRQLMNEVKGTSQEEKALADLELASGEFRALANFLRL